MRNSREGRSVFEITAKGKFTLLHSFVGSDGSQPGAGLVRATDGDFYGTTADGGIFNSGTVFSITLGVKLTTIYSFCAKTNCTDGSYPAASLIQAANRRLYGASKIAGSSGTPSGTAKRSRVLSRSVSASRPKSGSTIFSLGETRKIRAPKPPLLRLNFVSLYN
jgi:uncharacterized repeat protein (TIGR03803 family)